MRDIPHRRIKTTVAIAILLSLVGGSYLVLRKIDPLQGFEPSAIKDEREVKIQSLLDLLKLEKEDFKAHAELANLYFALAEYRKAEQHALEAVRLGELHGADKEFLTQQYLLLSKIYQALKDDEKALAYAEKAAALAPKQTAPLKRKGKVYEAQNKDEKARLAYLKAMELDDKDPETYALLADQEFKKGNKKAALEWLKMGVRRNAENARAFRNLARGYVRTKQYEKAKEAYRRALALDPKNADLRFEYAKLLKRLGDNDGYLAELRKAHAIEGKNPQLLAALGDAEAASGNKKRALELYRDALKRDGRNQALRSKYQALYDQLRSAGNENKATAIAAKGDQAARDKLAPQDTDKDATKNAHDGSDSAAAKNADAAANARQSDSAASNDGSNTLDAGRTSKNANTSGSAAGDLDAGKKSFAEKDYNAAEAHFRSALQKDADNADARYYLARTLDAQGKKEAAIAEYKRVLDKDPNNAKASYFLGRLYYQAQKYTDAERYFKKSAAVDAKFAPAQYSLGLAQDKQGKSAEALASYRRAAESDSKLTQAHFNSAIILKKEKKYNEALAELAKSGNGSDVEYQKGEILLKQKNYAAARDAFNKALEQKPQHYEAAFNLALAYHKLKDTAGADRAISRVLQKDSPADLHYTYGKLLEDSGELSGAEKQYRASVQKDPRYFKGWLNLGRVAAKAGKNDQAENAYRQAVQLDSASYDANYNLANTLYKQQKYQNAVEYFEAAKRESSTRDVVLPLATCYEKSDQYEKSARMYTDYLTEHAKDRVALEKLGYLYYRKIKNKDKALEQFNKLLKYYPDSDKVDEYRGMVRLIEKQKAD